jgi:hypothetical protein
MATAGGLQTHLRQRFHRLQQRPCHHPLLSIIVDAPHVKNDMAVLEVEVTAVGLTFEGDGSHLEIPWGDGMVPTDGMTCYILQPHLHPATTGGFVQKWGCTNRSWLYTPILLIHSVDGILNLPLDYCEPCCEPSTMFF